MRIVDNATWVSAIEAGVTAMHAAHAARGWFDSHNLVNWLNGHRNTALNAVVANYRITGDGRPARNPVHTATREIGKFIERHLGQIKIDDRASWRDPISLTGGGTHPGDECVNSVWEITTATTLSAQQGVQSTSAAAILGLDDLYALDLD